MRWNVYKFYYKLIMLGYKVDDRIIVKFPGNDRDGFELYDIDDVIRDDEGNIVIKTGGVDDGENCH